LRPKPFGVDPLRDFVWIIESLVCDETFAASLRSWLKYTNRSTAFSLSPPLVVSTITKHYFTSENNDTDEACILKPFIVSESLPVMECESLGSNIALTHQIFAAPAINASSSPQIPTTSLNTEN
jgi:hypothetical protein